MRINTHVLFSVCLSALLLSACSKTEVAQSTANSTSVVVPVRATVIKQGYVEDVLNVTGKTRAILSQKIFAPIAGRIVELKALEGMMVTKGEVLARIETKEARASVEGARVLLEQAKTPEEKLTAERMLNEAEQSVNGVAVRASLSGKIDVKTANQGEYVAEGQEMLTIIDPSSTAFIANVPLNEMGKIRVGMAARISLPGLSNMTLSAHAFAVKSRVVPESQTAEVILNFDHVPPTMTDALRTDVNGTASFILNTHSSALVVPKSALLRNDETNSFTIVSFGPDSIAYPIQVHQGSSRDSLVEVIGPDVHPGMNVITEGAYALPDSTRITLIH